MAYKIENISTSLT
ncbi:1119b38c-a1b4-4e49-bfbf-c59a229aa141 [Thermothielavioides terrestris]|uniref:1119b38c-a1b4-4e49-bfbf-c59a229aa141 n=1 Tax=Thermothielavioides terrestris TaxID=2587410 RepID=A0A3S4C9K3_9PEZI|nr:1119b38c-a1b4-4e49-bfbf-c59a229aa141 [Thermothielavioides terrestris]